MTAVEQREHRVARRHLSRYCEFHRRGSGTCIGRPRSENPFGPAGYCVGPHTTHSEPIEHRCFYEYYSGIAHFW
jgi:hypothetical protein